MTQIFIAASGMINPCGVGVKASSAAVRAGINRYTDSMAENQLGEPIKLASVPDECLPELSDEQCTQAGSLYKRILQLGIVALDEACAELELDQSIPIFLALPEERCGQALPAMQAILKDLNNACQCPIDLLTSRIYPQGRAAGVLALHDAYELLTTSSVSQVMVGGIDSYADLELLRKLDAEKRMLGDNSFDGFVPGEGAAFIVLKKAHPSAQSDKGLGVYSPAQLSEPGHLYSDENCLGEGLTQSIYNCAQNAMQSGLNQKVSSVLCSLNGESHHVKEWSFALTRNGALFNENITIEHPAENFGDIGAATVPTLMGIAQASVHSAYLPRPILIWAASDNESRGAFILNDALILNDGISNNSVMQNKGV